jgi:hypothetical protein
MGQQLTRYKSYSIYTQGKDYNIVQGKHILACGLVNESEDALGCAKRMIDANFETFILSEIRKLPPTKR